MPARATKARGEGGRKPERNAMYVGRLWVRPMVDHSIHLGCVKKTHPSTVSVVFYTLLRSAELIGRFDIVSTLGRRTLIRVVDCFSRRHLIVDRELDSRAVFVGLWCGT